MKKQSGITLISLVITIIVMLILAGVSLSMVIGDNGILNQAQEAVVATGEATIKDEMQFQLIEWQTEYYTNQTSMEGRKGTTPTGAVVTYKSGVLTYANGSEIYTATVDANGQMTNFTSATDTSSQLYKAIHPEEHIPTGFTHVEGTTWDTGYVIVDSAGNEFVWIPVIDSSFYAKKMGSRNYHLTAQDVPNHDPNIDPATVVKNDILGKTSILGTAITDDSAYPEAAVVNAAGGFWVGRYEAGIANAKRETSVAPTYSNGASDIKVQAGLEPARGISQETSLAYANAWLNGTGSVTADAATGTVAAESGLITGTQWDLMCDFIGWSTADSNCSDWGNYYNKGSKTYTEDIWHSTGNNYTWVQSLAADNYAKAESTYAIFPTGKFTNADNGTTVKNNIYDVAGNVWEWTTETLNRDATHRVLRGGSAHNYGDDYLATYRHGDNVASDTYWRFGFRLVLYVQ